MNHRQYEFLVYFTHFSAIMVTLLLVVLLLPGFQLHTTLLGLIGVTSVFAVLTTIIKPLLEFTLSPLVILFSPLITIALNTLMLYLTELLTDGIFSIDGFLWALLGGAIVGIISTIIFSLDGVIRRRLFVQYHSQRRQHWKDRMRQAQDRIITDKRLR